MCSYKENCEPCSDTVTTLRWETSEFFKFSKVSPSLGLHTGVAVLRWQQDNIMHLTEFIFQHDTPSHFECFLMLLF